MNISFNKITTAISLSLTLGISAPFAFAADSTEIRAESTEKEMEKVTVYGRHNRLILESGTATKSNLSLLETPAPIVVVDEVLLLEQGQNTLQDAIRNVSGLTQSGNNYGIGDNLSLRGLGVNFTIDGVYAGADLDNNYNPTRSLTNIESIEVLKGPATGLYGTGAAGGIINLIEKKPQFTPSYEARASVGSFESYSLFFDATNKINDDLAYRLVVNHEDSEGYRDRSSERSEIYASLRYKASKNHEFIFSSAYIDDAIQIDSIGDPVRLIDLSFFNLDPATITADDLANGPIADGGLQLTDAQRQILADTILSTDGIQPFALGDDVSLVSPLSTPNEGEEFRFKIRHDADLGADWFLTQQLLYRTYDSDYIRQTSAYNYIYVERNGITNLEPRAPLVIDDELYPYAARRQEYRNITASEDTIQYFFDLSNSWELNSIEGEHLVTFNYENRDISFQQLSIWDGDDSRSLPVPYILDIRNPNFPTGSFEDFIDEENGESLRSKYDKTLQAWGINLQEVVHFNDALIGRFAVAVSGVKQEYTNLRLDAEEREELDFDDSGFTYNLGLTYRITEDISTFVNFAKGRTAASVLGSLQAFDNTPDTESESFDLGLRFTALNEQLLGSIVIFETSRTNIRHSNFLFEDNPDDPAFNITVPEFLFDENDSTQGVELDLNFDINEQWAMNVNATYQDPITEPGSGRESREDEETKGLPKTFARTWLSYSNNFGVLKNPLKLSLGISYEDERSIDSSSFGIDRAYVNSYSKWDAAVSYEGDNWKAQLNVRNLTDKDYYSNALFLGGLPGAERNAELTLNYFF